MKIYIAKIWQIYGGLRPPGAAIYLPYFCNIFAICLPCDAIFCNIFCNIWVINLCVFVQYSIILLPDLRSYCRDDAMYELCAALCSVAHHSTLFLNTFGCIPVALSSIFRCVCVSVRV